VRDLSGLNGSTKPWSCYPQELMPTEHIVALLIAERDKLLGCRSLTRELFLAFLDTVAPFRVFEGYGQIPKLPPEFQIAGRTR